MLREGICFIKKYLLCNNLALPSYRIFLEFFDNMVRNGHSENY